MIEATRACIALLFVLLAFLAQLSYGDLNDDVPYLLAQRDAITNWQAWSKTNNVTGWNTTTELCYWSGIGCYLDRGTYRLTFDCYVDDVTGKPFDSAVCQLFDGKPLRATGTLAPELANAAFLVDLSLREQNFTGSIPSAWGETGRFPRLESIDMYNNQLTGSLPDSFFSRGALPSLRYLALPNNKLTGTLPPFFTTPAAIPSLEVLDLSGNLYQGTLPASWALTNAFSHVSLLALSNTPGINGSIPINWAQQATNLTAFFFYGTNLCGPVPQRFYQPMCDPYDLPGGDAEKRSLYTETSCIDGIPSLAACTANSMKDDVPILLAQRNAISNWDEWVQALNLPDWNTTTPLCDWTGISCYPERNTYGVYLGCGRAPIDGSIPYDCYGGLQGSLAPELADAAFLEYLVVNDQPIQGSIPPAWFQAGKFPRLKLMNVGRNLLVGPLPNVAPGAFPHLEELALTSEGFTGTLPDSWGRDGAFTNVTLLSVLSNTRLTGTIPSTWATGFPKLAYLEISNTSLCGDVPSALYPPICDPYQPFVDENGQPDTFRVITDVPCIDGVPALPMCPNGGSPLGAPIAATPATTSSTLPIGAIIGGVVGGCFGLGCIVLFAFSPGRGWLRKRIEAINNKLGRDWGADSYLDPGLDASGTYIKESKALSPRCLHRTSGEVDTFLHPTNSSMPAWPSSQTDSLYSSATDPLLTYIASVVASQPALANVNMQPVSSQIGSISSKITNVISKSGRSALHADVRQWEVRWQDLQIEGPIGRGSFGFVYLAQWNQTPVAAKILALQANLSDGLELPEKTMRELQEESGVMARMRHPNIVSFMGLCAMPPCILTEYCPRGSVFDVLRRPAATAELTWHRRLGMALDAARGLLYLHTLQPPVVHRDVKSPNLLVDAAWQVKVSDFNLSKIMSGAHGAGDALSTNGPSNPIWLAPEVLESSRALPESDVYSFGLVMFELLTWQLPWGSASPFAIAKIVASGGRPEVPGLEAVAGPDKPDRASFEAYCHLMRECWAQEPAARPPFANIVTRLRLLVAGGAI